MALPGDVFSPSGLLGPDVEVDEVLAVLLPLVGDDAAADDVLAGDVHAPVLAVVLLDLALLADPVVEHLAEEGVLEGAVDDDAGQAVADREVLVVVDLVHVAGAGGPHDELLRRAVLHQLRYLVADVDVFEVDLVSHLCRLLVHDAGAALGRDQLAVRRCRSCVSVVRKSILPRAPVLSRRSASLLTLFRTSPAQMSSP